MTSNDKKLETRSFGFTPTTQIVILGQPPAFVFWDAWFHVGITLRTLLDSPVFGVTANLTAELVQALPVVGGDNELIGVECAFPNIVVDVNIAQLVVEGMQPIRITMPLLEGTATDSCAEKEHIAYIRCKIKRKQIVAGEHCYSIRFSSFEPISFPVQSDTTGFIEMAKGSWILTQTTNMKMVTSCLQVIVEDWPDVWYKDEGGREKSIQITVRLVDQQNQPVLSRCIHIYSTLVYDNDLRSPVTKQDKLRLLGPRKNYIDPETGTCSISFRIDDVSKNHQGMSFMVRIDAEASIEDVAPAFTPPVSVRSKRNKRYLLPDTPVAAADTSSHVFSPLQANRPTDMATLQNALKSVTDWTNLVAHNIQPLRWNVIGYAQLSDGSFDYNKPFHAMQNPNDFISKVLFMYKTEVQSNLNVLQSLLDSKGSRGSQRGYSPGKKRITFTNQVMIPTTMSAQSKASPLSFQPHILPIHPDPPPDLSEMILSFPPRQNTTPRAMSGYQPSSVPHRQARVSLPDQLQTVTPMSVNETSFSSTLNYQFPLYFDESSEEHQKPSSHV